MVFPIKTCVVCSEEFELRPNKPGFANRCPSCSEPEAESASGSMKVDNKAENSEMNEARRTAMRNMLYRRED